MAVLRVLAILALCAFPSPGWAQPWADAYRKGDYQTAASLLHPIVLEPFLNISFTDPAPARHLAVMYARGLGVATDPIAACALAQIAEIATNMVAPQFAHSFAAYEEVRKEGARLLHDLCDGLGESDRLAAGRSVGCLSFGMPEEVVTVGGTAVRVSRGGIRVVGAADQDAAPDLVCAHVVSRVRPVTIAPPADAAPGVEARHFVEMFAWHAGHEPRGPGLRYLLNWRLYEVRGQHVGPVAVQILDRSDHWPTGLPPEIDGRFSLDMIRSGHVRWRIEGAPPRRGWIMLPDEKAQ